MPGACRLLLVVDRIAFAFLWRPCRSFCNSKGRVPCQLYTRAADVRCVEHSVKGVPSLAFGLRFRETGIFAHGTTHSCE